MSGLFADQLVAVRVTATSIGTQDLQIIDRPGRDRQGAEIIVRLKRTSRLTGRVRTRAGEPAVGQIVEIWFRGGSWLRPNPVVFKDGPLRTGADGSFQTPDNLLIVSPYRLLVRAPGKETILSEWITIGEKSRVLLPMLQTPLRTIGGRVVDRQGKPLAGIDIFQSGDGPEPTATNTNADGRFALGGFCHGSVFLFEVVFLRAPTPLVKGGSAHTTIPALSPTRFEPHHSPASGTGRTPPGRVPG
jgi:hypothetical protein